MISEQNAVSLISSASNATPERREIEADLRQDVKEEHQDQQQRGAAQGIDVEPHRQPQPAPG